MKNSLPYPDYNNLKEELQRLLINLKNIGDRIPVIRIQCKIDDFIEDIELWLMTEGALIKSLHNKHCRNSEKGK